MKHAFYKTLMLAVLLLFSIWMAVAQTGASGNDSTASVDKRTATTETSAGKDSAGSETLLTQAATDAPLADGEAEEEMGWHQSLKTKFIEGNAGFMSLVALALVLGLAFCIERIIYLSLSEINAKRFMADLDRKIEAGDIEAAKDLCRDTRGPVASICYQGLLRINERIDNIERSVISYGSVQAANLEKGCSWITLFIDRYGDGVRPDRTGRRHQCPCSSIGHESGPHHHHLRHYCSPDSSDFLQLYPLENRAFGGTDGGIVYLAS